MARTDTYTLQDEDCAVLATVNGRLKAMRIAQSMSKSRWFPVVYVVNKHDVPQECFREGNGTFARQLPEPVGTPNPPVKSSQEWADEYGLEVHDPDGWDRSNFEASWNEPITEDVFRFRAMQSTCSGDFFRLMGIPS